MATTTRILIADRNLIFQSVLHRMLTAWGYDVVVASDGFEAFSLLQAEDGPRMAILDAQLPGMSVVEICRRVRALNQLTYAYLLLLTGSGPVEDLVAAIDAGVDDYVTRPVHSQELRARLQVGSRIVQLQERLIRAKEELYEKASRDSLTGLWNREAIIQVLDREVCRASRGGTGLAVVMANIDHFKRVNDHFGHTAGDAVLRETAHRMSSVLRGYDSIGRFGGEEFLIVVPECRFEGSTAVAERLREIVACQPCSTSGADCAVTCSFGLAWTSCATASDANQLLREAGAVLHEAKRNGRNRVETCTAIAV